MLKIHLTTTPRIHHLDLGCKKTAAEPMISRYDGAASRCLLAVSGIIRHPATTELQAAEAYTAAPSHRVYCSRARAVKMPVTQHLPRSKKPAYSTPLVNRDNLIASGCSSISLTQLPGHPGNRASRHETCTHGVRSSCAKRLADSDVLFRTVPEELSLVTEPLRNRGATSSLHSLPWAKMVQSRVRALATWHFWRQYLYKP